MTPLLPLQQAPDGEGLNLLGDLLLLLPRLAVGVAVLGVGYAVGSYLGGKASSLSGRVGLGERLTDTPLGATVAGPRSFDRVLGAMVKWYLFLVAVLMAVGLVGFGRLAGLLGAAASYAPLLIAAVVIAAVGFVIANYAGRAVARSEAARATGLAGLLGAGTRVVLYVFVALVALDTAGVSTALLDTFATAFAFGLALTVALAAGLSVGLGAQDYVADNVEEVVAELRSERRGEGESDAAGPDESGPEA